MLFQSLSPSVCTEHSHTCITFVPWWCKPHTLTSSGSAGFLLIPSLKKESAFLLLDMWSVRIVEETSHVAKCHDLTVKHERRNQLNHKFYKHFRLLAGHHSVVLESLPFAWFFFFPHVRWGHIKISNHSDMSLLIISSWVITGLLALLSSNHFQSRRVCFQ